MAVKKTKAHRAGTSKTSARTHRAKPSMSNAGSKRVAVARPRKNVPAPRAEKVAEAEPRADLPKPQAPIAAPGLFEPREGEPSESLTPNFRWFYVGGATHYELMWSRDLNFRKDNKHILLTNQTAALLPPDEALDPGETYAWHVRAGNEGGWGPWSPTRTFRTPER